MTTRTFTKQWDTKEVLIFYMVGHQMSIDQAAEQAADDFKSAILQRAEIMKNDYSAGGVSRVLCGSTPSPSPKAV